jgi:two-component system, chemotaxis family, protein-glutamate methylesterase/glutaminase
MTASPSVIRVVVVEDSMVQQAHLVRSLEAEGDIEVVGRATTTTDAVARVFALRPDVVTLDLHLEDGDGRSVIEQIMAHTPTPILVLSSIVTGPRSAVAVEALAAGALEALPKPARWTAGDEVQLRRSVRRLNKVLVIRHLRGHVKRDRPPVTRSGGMRSPAVALASSAGGPAALAVVLSGLAGLAAPVLVVQHLHADFIDGLASWMARVSPLPVEVAQHGGAARPGHVYIAPGHFHLRLDAGNCLALDAAPPTTIAHPPTNSFCLWPGAPDLAAWGW